MTRPARNRTAGQSGYSLLEYFLAAVIGIMLVASAGYLFLGQVRGYRDIGTQARLQTMTKIAVQAMNTEIANTGACLANKRYKFTMLPTQIQFTYMDLKARHCASSDTVTMAYYVKAAKGNDTLMEKIACNSRPPSYHPLIKGVGAITLGLTYYDVNGATTATASRVKAVEFNLDVKSSGKSLYKLNRNPKVRVELLN
jgi:hypothetical protein